jgi:Ca-activated chloride channel family protein
MTEQRERRTLLALADQRPPGTRIFAIGVGNEVERPLLEQLAEEAGGLAAFVSRGDDFERQARGFRRKLLRPAATGVELEFSGGGVYDLEPEKLPSLHHGMPLRLYGRYREPGRIGLRVRGEVGGELLDKTVELELPGDGDANPQIERMWAWHRVQRLLKQADREGSRAAVIDEIVRLGEGYSIVTEYTSFLVLENDAEYRRWKIERRNALRIERDRAQQERVRRRLDELRSEATDGLGPTSVEEPVKTASAPVRPDLAGPTRIADAPQRQRSNSADLDLGGGAVDPLSAGIAAALAGLGLARLRRRR